MLRNILPGFAGAVGVMILIVIAARGAPRRQKGVRALHWPAPLRYFIVFMLAASVGIAWMASKAKPDQVVMAALVSGFFVLGSLYLAYCVFFYRVWWTTEGMGSWHPLGGTRFLRWADVEQGGYSPNLQAHWIEGGGTRIWYSPMQAGIPVLHRYIGLNLKPDIVREA